MIVLLISCHVQTHKIAFGDDRAAAEEELAKLLPLIGYDRWGRNGDEENPTHTIRCPCGDVTVVLKKVEVARLLDTDKDTELHEAESNRSLDREIEVRRRLAAEGLIETFPLKARESR